MKTSRSDDEDTKRDAWSRAKKQAKKRLCSKKREEAPSKTGAETQKTKLAPREYEARSARERIDVRRVAVEREDGKPGALGYQVTCSGKRISSADATV